MQHKKQNKTREKNTGSIEQWLQNGACSIYLQPEIPNE